MQLTHIPAHHETKIHQILIELHACAEKRCPAGFLLSCFFCKNFRQDNKTSFSLKCTLSKNNTQLSGRMWQNTHLSHICKAQTKEQDVTAI